MTRYTPLGFFRSTTQREIDDAVGRFDRHVPEWEEAVEEYETKPSAAKRQRVVKLNDKMFGSLRPLARLQLAYRNKRDELDVDIDEPMPYEYILKLKFWNDAYQYATRHLNKRLKMLETTDYMY